MTQRITSRVVRYIKLGPKGDWENLCLTDGTLRLGYYEISHALAKRNDAKLISDYYMKYKQCKSQVATGYANQILDFYRCDENEIWITFSSGYLWWCQAKPAIEYFGQDPEQYPYGSRLRRTTQGWNNKTLGGHPLLINELNGRLTKTAAYRQAICIIKNEETEYLLRKLNDEELPVIEEAKRVRTAMLQSLQKLMRHLTWQDFELLVDLIFSQSGWRRNSVVGADMKTIDMEMVLPSTGERAVVQVKSSTNQAQLQEYEEHFAPWAHTKKFYVYHSARAELSTSASDIILIGPEKLAEMILEAGLSNWLLKKAG